MANPVPLWWFHDGDLLAATTDVLLPHRSIDLSTVIPDWPDYEARCRAGGPLPTER